MVATQSSMTLCTFSSMMMGPYYAVVLSAVATVVLHVLCLHDMHRGLRCLQLCAAGNL